MQTLRSLMLRSSALKWNGRECVWLSKLHLLFPKFLQWNAFRGIFCIELNIQVSRITVIIDWFNCLVINENFSSSINACNVASMLNNPLCSRAWKSHQCKSRLWEEKKCKLKNSTYTSVFFFFTNKEHNFFIFFSLTKNTLMTCSNPFFSHQCWLS